MGLATASLLSSPPSILSDGEEREDEEERAAMDYSTGSGSGFGVLCCHGRRLCVRGGGAGSEEDPGGHGHGHRRPLRAVLPPQAGPVRVRRQGTYVQNS